MGKVAEGSREEKVMKQAWWVQRARASDGHVPGSGGEWEY